MTTSIFRGRITGIAINPGEKAIRKPGFGW
jgi:hypothetical protein